MRPPLKRSISDLFRRRWFRLGLLLPTALLTTPCCAADRATEVVAAIEEWNASLDAADRDAKYAKMAVSAFDFYRGTNHLFWMDFAGDPRLETYGGSTETRTWLQADLHANNYGAFHDDDGHLVYDLNDFDESVIADYQYDLWRMAVSLVLVARANGLSTSEQEKAVDDFVEGYLDAIEDVRGNDDETVTIFTEDNTHGRLDEFLDEVGEEQSRSKMLKKWTNVSRGVRTFDLELDDLRAPTDSQRAAIVGAMPAYGETLRGGLDYDPGHFAVKDVARRLNAGTGSLGTSRYYVLIEGETDSTADDRILDVKAQGRPTPCFFLGDAFRASCDAGFAHHAHRHADAYEALSLHTDDYLGSLLLDGTGYSVRERSPFKETFDTAELTSARRLGKLCRQWGTILAMAHARADRDAETEHLAHSFDGAVHGRIDGHHAEIRALVRSIAVDYADQVEADHAAFLDHRTP